MIKEQLREELKGNQTLITDSREAIMGLQSQVSTLENTKRQLEENNSTLRMEITMLRQQADELLTDMSTRQEETRQLDQALLKSRDRQRALEKQLRALGVEVLEGDDDARLLQQDTAHMDADELRDMILQLQEQNTLEKKAVEAARMELRLLRQSQAPTTREENAEGGTARSSTIQKPTARSLKYDAATAGFYTKEEMDAAFTSLAVKDRIIQTLRDEVLQQGQSTQWLTQVESEARTCVQEEGALVASGREKDAARITMDTPEARVLAAVAARDRALSALQAAEARVQGAGASSQTSAPFGEMPP